MSMFHLRQKLLISVATISITGFSTHAIAQTTTISTSSSMAVILGAGQSLSVTGTGDLSLAGDAVTVTTGQIAGDIEVQTGGQISTTGANNEAIFVQGTLNDGLSNAGTINADDASTINITGIVNNGITNSGTISSTAASNSTIFINGTSNADVTGGIINQTGGMITSSGDIAIELNGSSVTVDNITNQSGATISSSGFGGGDHAINLTSSAQITGNLTNAGTLSSISGPTVNVTGNARIGNIVNQAGGVIESTANDGISLNSSNQAGTITNDGRIAGTVVGIQLLSNNGNTSIVNNSGGEIVGTNTAGIQISNDNTGSITNSGTITGSNGIQVSFGQLNGGIILNDGVIEGTGGTAINLSNLSGSTPITINGGRIVGDVTDNNPANDFSIVNVAGTFVTEGNFDVSALNLAPTVSDFTISAGNTVAADSFSPAPGATLRFGVESTANRGFLLANSGALNLTGLNIAAVVDDATQSLAVDDEISVAAGAGQLTGITGTLGQTLTTIDDNSLLFNFAIADGSQAEITSSTSNSTLFLLVSQGTTNVEQASTPNNGGVAELFDGALSGSSDPEITSINNSLAGASTAEELNEILEATLPGTVDSGSFIASSNTSAQTFSLAGNRLAGIRSGGPSGISSGDVTEGLQMWVQAFGQALDQDERGGIDGFDADTFGIAVGFDTEKLHKDVVVGVALAYANTDVNSENANRTDTDIDSYQIALYGDYDIDDRTYISASLGYTFGENNSTRFDVGGVSGLNANADFNSDQFTAQIKAGRNYEFADLKGVTLTPNVLANYLYYDAESFTETGAGGANLTVDNDAVQQFELGVGLDAKKDYVLENGNTLTPEVSLGYRFDFVNDSVQATSSFIGGGSAFEVEGFRPAQSTFNLGLAASYETSENWDITLNYDYETRSDFNSHAAFVRASYKF